jgi:hypothetical protein
MVELVQDFWLNELGVELNIKTFNEPPWKDKNIFVIDIV